MNSIDAFKKCCQIIITKYPLSGDDVALCIKKLLPGHRYGRSASGPRAYKYLFDDSGEIICSSDLNYVVGMHALQMAADSNYKKAIIDAFKTQNKINALLRSLRYRLEYDYELNWKMQIITSISDDIHQKNVIDIRIDDFSS